MFFLKREVFLGVAILMQIHILTLELLRDVAEQTS